jgi:hypothetical protein
LDSTSFYLIAADAILLLHVLFVVFIVLGLLLIFAGNALSWQWVRNPWFRLLHLIAIAVVVIQSWLLVICPLTIFEMALRERAGDAAYAGTFISHWLETLLYYRAPPWVFIVCYTLFGGIVIFSWFYVRPRHFFKADDHEKDERDK